MPDDLVRDLSATANPGPLPWLPSFAVGDARIDAEHRELIVTANDLCALAGCHNDHRVIRGAARELIAVTEAHFASEEKLFPAIGFTGMLSHIREHLAIQQSLGSLLLDGDLPDLIIAAATARLLLVEHIVRHDLGFKTWVQVAQGC
jgi:hemerythrin